MLVLGKTYTISKSAVVPTTVRSDEELVEANSKLAVISAIAVVVAAPFAGALLKLGGPGWSLALALIVFAVATGFAVQLPQARGRDEPVDEAERQELRSAGITLAASAMGLVRGIVGFVAFMLAFDFKNSGAPLWQLGLRGRDRTARILPRGSAGARVRRLASEERITHRHARRDGGRRPRHRGGRRPGRCRHDLAHHRSRIEHGQAGLRRDRATRRARCEPRPLVRSVRDEVPAVVGDRRADPDHHPDPGRARLRAARRGGDVRRDLLPRGHVARSQERGHGIARAGR